jgi:acetylglutamate kinase
VTTRPDWINGTVIKLGGSTLGAHDTSLRDIADASKRGSHLIVVHGGGAAVSDWLKRMNIEPKFVRGLRVTDAATLEVVVAVLAGLVNKQLVAQLTALGVDAQGVSGADEACLQAEQYDPELGFVGRITYVNEVFLSLKPYGGTVPVVAPIAIEPKTGQLLNTNADTAAGEIAAATKVARLVFLTDVAGVLDAEGRLIERLTSAEAQALIDSGVAGGGMIPKLEAAIRAASVGCRTRIVDGTQEGALRRALAGEPLGTTITG